MNNNYRRRHYEKSLDDETTTKTASPPVEEKTEPETRKGVIIGAPLINARKNPEYANNVVTVLRSGDEVSIIGEHDNYYKILIENRTRAYVLKKYCKEV